MEQVLAALMLGVAAGLLPGKILNVFGVARLAVRLGATQLPAGANWKQMAGVASLRRLGLTMGLFIGICAFAQSPVLQEEMKLGILGGSLAAGLIGAALLRFAGVSRQAARVTGQCGRAVTWHLVWLHGFDVTSTSRCGGAPRHDAKPDHFRATAFGRLSTMMFANVCSMPLRPAAATGPCM